MSVSERRAANILGAFALGLADRLVASAENIAGEGASIPSALATLYAYRDPSINIERLRRILNLSHSATVRLVDRLERQGMVVRRRADQDGRSRCIVLTKVGCASAQEILFEREQVLQQALAALEPDQQVELVGILERLLPVVTGSRDPADIACRLCDHRLCIETDE